MGKLAIGLFAGISLTLAALFALGFLRPFARTSTPDNAPEFRLAVREAVESSRPACQLSTLASNEFIMAPAKVELSKFRHRLDGGPYAAQFDLAEADADYVQSISQVECQAPDKQSDPKELRQAALAATVRHLKALEARLRD